MKSLPLNLDKTAIGLSLACALHCLLLPILLTIIPALTTNLLGNENFHQWMLIAVLPTSLIALTLGCKRHRQLHVLALGLLGLGVLVLTFIFTHTLLDETGEKIASLAGAVIIAYSHWRNHSLYQRFNCQCDK